MKNYLLLFQVHQFYEDLQIELVLSHIKNENEYTDNIINPHKELVSTLYKEARSYIRETYDTYASLHNDRDIWKYFRRFKEGEEYPSHWRRKVLPDSMNKSKFVIGGSLIIPLFNRSLNSFGTIGVFPTLE